MLAVRYEARRPPVVFSAYSRPLSLEAGFCRHMEDRHAQNLTSNVTKVTHQVV